MTVTSEINLVAVVRRETLELSPASAQRVIRHLLTPDVLTRAELSAAEGGAVSRIEGTLRREGISFPPRSLHQPPWSQLWGYHDAREPRGSANRGLKIGMPGER